MWVGDDAGGQATAGGWPKSSGSVRSRCHSLVRWQPVQTQTFQGYKVCSMLVCGGSQEKRGWSKLEEWEKLGEKIKRGAQNCPWAGKRRGGTLRTWGAVWPDGSQETRGSRHVANCWCQVPVERVVLVVVALGAVVEVPRLTMRTHPHCFVNSEGQPLFSFFFSLVASYLFHLLTIIIK